MSNDNYTLNNGHEVEKIVYLDALHKAWAVYGALVAGNHLPAYNYDGSEKQQLAKYNNILLCVEDITSALAAFHGDLLGGDFADWERENKTTAPDEDFDTLPTSDNDIVDFIHLAIKRSKLPYKLVHTDPETQTLVDELNELVREANMPAEPPKKKGRPQGRKAKRKSGK